MMGVQNDGEDKPMDDESYSWTIGEYRKSLGVSTNPSFASMLHDTGQNTLK
ncbi:MAG: hypothetical protein JW896_00710 [Deltaproteobacteria bacterium]|nr:hypothetical protein [Deltaproteobacteria bacterium]